VGGPEVSTPPASRKNLQYAKNAPDDPRDGTIARDATPPEQHAMTEADEEHFEFAPPEGPPVRVLSGDGRNVYYWPVDNVFTDDKFTPVTFAPAVRAAVLAKPKIGELVEAATAPCGRTNGVT
jgi:hypothetical protein